MARRALPLGGAAGFRPEKPLAQRLGNEAGGDFPSFGIPEIV
jgi:hypothetical protein